MSRIVISNLPGADLEVSDHSKTLLRHFQDHHIDWMYACGGKGRCTTCKFVIAKGAPNFEPLTPAEERYLAMGALRDGERLACQAKINGDVVVTVPRENQLPHMRYSDEQDG